MDNLAKIDIERIKLGVRFSEPVYFDDGKSMFLAARKAVKQYHLQALKQWEIRFLLRREAKLRYRQVFTVPCRKTMIWRSCNLRISQ